MPAPVIAFDSAEAPNKRAEQVFDRFHAIYDAIRQEMNAFEEPHKGLFMSLWSAACAVKFHHDRRTAMAERTLRYLLASETMGEDLRQRALAVLVGKQKVGRDPHLLTEHETAMIQQYRTMDPAARQMLRTLFERLAATSPEATQ